MSDAPEVVVEAPAVENEPERPSRVAMMGKGITLANFVLAILFLTVAVFFRVNKIQAMEKKRGLEETTRNLLAVEADRKKIVDGLNQEKEAEEKRLQDVMARAKQEIGDIESEIARVQQRIEAARDQQKKLNEESVELGKQQAQLLAEIEKLREDREDTHGAEEGLVADRAYLEDLLAKTLNELRQAEFRGQEIERHLAELGQRSGS